LPGSTFGYVILALLLVFNSLLATARAALVGASRPRLRQLADGGSGGAARALRVAEDATPLIATVRLVQSASRFLAAGLLAVLVEPSLAAALSGWAWLGGQSGPVALLLVMLLAALLVVTLGELLPEAWVMRAPEQWAIFLAPLVAALEWLLGPLVRFMLFLSGRITRPIAGRQVPFVTEEEIKTLVDAGEEGGVIEEEEKEMIYSIFAIGDTLAREIMIPRIDMLALEVTTPLPDAVEAVLTAGHSRIPVYQENIDNIVGLLYAKDLLRAWRDNDQALALRALLRPAYFVPETKKVDELLAELQAKRIHLAVVVDEYGGTAGIVTMEDIVEEIVGEIRDEYDVNEESQFERVNDNEYIFDARIDLDEVNDRLELTLPSGESDSLGGFIYGQLGHVPTPGEKVSADPVEFEVLSVTGRRIRKVRALRRPVEPTVPPEPRRNGNGHGNGHGHPASGEPTDAD
jgi:CBS domain containing-hemolysin-like protein